MKVKTFSLVFVLVILELTSALPDKRSHHVRKAHSKQHHRNSILSHHEKSFNLAKKQSFNSLQTRQQPSQDYSISELTSKYGYPLEVYTDVETEDGYLLTVHRIPHGRNSTKTQGNKKVVFLMHGLLCSSVTWVSMGPEKDLAFLLADRGYDVWMGNARGNTYSRKHKTFDPDVDRREFWDFSWDEMGYYDLPAMIDLVLEKTGQEKVHYIGHSQGTTTFFVMASERPEYNKKIELMQALAPVVFVPNVPSLFLQLLARLIKLGSIFTNLIGQYEFLPNDELFIQLGQEICNTHAIFTEICANVVFLIAGYNSKQLNVTMLPVILANVPAGASTKQFIHYAQNMISGEFRKYNYGPLQNMLNYGSLSPPEYNLDNVDAPVALYYGDNDNFVGEEDVMTLKGILKNVVSVKKVSTYNHLDFLWAVNTPTLLNKDVLSLMERY